jgi:alpha-galactosidase
VHSVDFRAATAIWGHFGVEWDLTLLDEDELERLAAWVRFYREHRALLHSGTVVRADLANPALQLDGVVSGDRRTALYRLSALDQSEIWPPGAVPLPGLEPSITYRVTLTGPSAALFGSLPDDGSAWWCDGATTTGRMAETLGLQCPLLGIDQSVPILARANDSGSPPLAHVGRGGR